jgi:hypothetical protein
MTVQKGELYSRNYLKKEKLEKDSVRFRKRIATYFSLLNSSSHIGTEFCTNLELQGVDVPRGESGHGYSTKAFFETAAINDILDSITILNETMNQPCYSQLDGRKWKNFIEIAFREEGLDYTLEEKCGVHPYVDAEFQQNKTSTLSFLDKEELKGVKHEFEQAFDKLNSSRKDTKGAIKAINEAVEALVKGLNDIGRPDTLGQALSKLEGFINKIYENEKVGLAASKDMIESLKNWNKSCHNYRHGKDADKINNPSEEYTILMLSQGASYIRWLLDIEQLYINTKEREEQK